MEINKNQTTIKRGDLTNGLYFYSLIKDGEKIESGKVKIEIFKKYKLENVIEAHKELESRKILGPAIIVP